MRLKTLKKIGFFILVIIIMFFINIRYNYAFELDDDEEKISVRSVLFKGNVNFATSYLNSIIGVEAGEYSRDKVIQRISLDKEILARLGFFSDIEVELDSDGILTFIVEENPMVSSVEFYGINQVKSSYDDTDTVNEIYKLNKLMPNTILNPVVLAESISNIKEYYYFKGFPLVEISPIITVDTELNRASVIYEIIENHKVKINRTEIYFYEDYNRFREFLKRFITRWRVKQTDRKDFNPLQLEHDINGLRFRLYNNGYIESRIEAHYYYNETKDKVNITINIFQGEQYNLGDVEVSGNTIFTTDEIFDKITIDKGEVYKNNEFMESIEAINLMYRERGYLDADVDFNYRLTDDNYIHYKLTITEGQQYYINDIIIRGNLKTYEKVIRRELYIKEGEIFDQRKIDMSRRNLIMLNFFDSVQFYLEQAEQDNYKDLIIEVVEGRTGTLTFGAGYSSVDRFVGFVEVSKDNFDLKDLWSFTGKGQKIHIKSEFGRKRTNYEIGWEDPWFNDKTDDTSVPSPEVPIFLGYRIYNLKRVLSYYDITRVGGNVQVGRRFGFFNRLFVRYQYEHIKIDNVYEPLAPFDIVFKTDELDDTGYPVRKLDERGRSKEVSSSVNINFVRNTTDNPRYPTRGYILSLFSEISGGILGGDIDYLKPTLDFSYFIPLFQTGPGRHCIAFRVRGSVVNNVFSDKPLPDYSRFYLGGANTIRGYPDGEIRFFEERTYKITGSDTPVTMNFSRGGESQVFFNLEYRIPLVENQIYLAAFLDGGNIHSDSLKMNFNEFRYGTGVGVRIDTPVGQIRLDYGYRFQDTNERRRDKKQSEIHFSIGPMF